MLPEVVFGKQREVLEVRHRPEVVRSRAQLTQAPPVEAVVVVDVAQHILHRRALAPSELLLRKELALHEPTVLRQLFGANKSQIGGKKEVADARWYQLHGPVVSGSAAETDVMTPRQVAAIR